MKSRVNIYISDENMNVEINIFIKLKIMGSLPDAKMIIKIMQDVLLVKISTCHVKNMYYVKYY